MLNWIEDEGFVRFANMLPLMNSAGMFKNGESGETTLKLDTAFSACAVSVTGLTGTTISKSFHSEEAASRLGLQAD